MRIVFMGATELGWNCCRALLAVGQEVVGIFSIPQQFRISWSQNTVTNVQYRNFEDVATAHSIPLVYVRGKMSDPEYADALRSMRPDIIIVAGWYYILPRSLRALAPLGAAGLHASLLPKYRGGAPLVWAVINGETETGVTFFHFADGVDDGDVIGQEKFKINSEDNIANLIDQASRASVALLSKYIPLLATGMAPRIQQDHSQATTVPQRKPEDGLINWDRLSARQAYDWVRAQTRPYPGAFTFLGEEKVTIWRATPMNEQKLRPAVPGAIVREDLGAAGVCCADGRVLRIDEVGLADDSTLTGEDFSRHRNIAICSSFAVNEAVPRAT